MNNILLGIVSGIILTWVLTMDCKNKNDNKKNNKKENLINVEYPIDMMGGYATANLNNTTYSKTKLGWIENSRNNRNYKKYPPCFNLSLPAQEIFNILEANELIIKHKVLFEVYSMILCQVTYLKSKLCPQTMLLDRIKDLDAFGAPRYSNYIENLKKYVSKSQIDKASPISLEFLNKSLYLIDHQINQINLPSETTKLIKNLNNEICIYAFPIIITDC